MRVAIIGGGITGMVCAYELSKKGHHVSLFEKSSTLGGLAAGFRKKNWEWPLEYCYHHIFKNDFDIIRFADEIGFKGLYFSSPQTASLAEDGKEYGFDTPLDLLRFPHLSIAEKIRAGCIIFFLKASPFLSYYQTTTSTSFLKTFMGKRAWSVLWEQLFRKKFGKYADNILASFIWARIKKRTKELGYVRGGFQAFVDFLEKKLIGNNVIIYKKHAIVSIQKIGRKYAIEGVTYDAIVSTLVSPQTAHLASSFLPKSYARKLKKVSYLHAVVLIIESKSKLLKKTYWLNILTKHIPIMGLVQHTNFIDRKHYGKNHILYVANYVEEGSRLLAMSKKELCDYFLPYLTKINPHFASYVSCYAFKAFNTQPVVDKDFIVYKPTFITPARHFYIANLDMTYPFDRGVNFSVRLGKRASEIVLAG